jgi:hypothetical protein
MGPNDTNCRFWHDGDCKAGDKCHFSHGPSPAEVEGKFFHHFSLFLELYSETDVAYREESHSPRASIIKSPNS